MNSLKVDHAGAKLETRAEPIYHSIWEKDANQLTLTLFTQNSGHPLYSSRMIAFEKDSFDETSKVSNSLTACTFAVNDLRILPKMVNIF